MPKCGFHETDLYPFWEIEDDPDDDDTVSDFTDAELADYARVMAEFYRWQGVIEKRYGQARAAMPPRKPPIEPTAKRNAHAKKLAREAGEDGIDWTHPWTKEAQAALEKYPLET